MKLAGSARIVITDSRTNQIKQVINKTNVITNYCLTEVLGPGAIALGSNARISISTSTVEPSMINFNLNGIIATGYEPTGIVSPTWNQTIDPPFGEIQNRIDFIEEERTFNTVALTNVVSSNKHNPIVQNRPVFAYLRLDTPCVQGAYDYLDIYYRVQFLNTGGQGLNRKALLEFGKSFFGLHTSSNAWLIFYLYWSFCNNPQPNLYKNLHGNTLDLIGSTATGALGISSGFWTSAEIFKVSSHFKEKFAKNFDVDDYVGRIINLTMQGKSHDDDSTFTANSFVNPDAPFQSAFTHSSAATKPFFDSLALASGNGKMRLDGSWTGKFPELYKISIASGGNTGIATYKWSVRKHLGFNGNTYTDLAVGCPFRNPNIAATDGMHGWKDENNDVQRFDDTKIVQYDDTGVTLLDVFDGTYKNFDSTTTPALPVTQARQVAVDPVGKKIYVGCRSTGLWIINVADNIITNQFGIPCYGVDIGKNGVVFAVVQTGLYSSANWSTALNFNFTGISDNNWSRIYFLKADPEHVDSRIALVTAVPSQNNRVVWWSVGTGTAVAGLQSVDIKPWVTFLDVSDIGGFWAYSNRASTPTAYRLTYGTATNSILTGTSISQANLTHSIYGNDNYYKVSFYKQYLIGQTKLVDINNTTVNSYTSLSGRTFIIHLDSGIVLTNKELRQLFTDNIYCWQDYGWDGSQWLLNHSGAKTTHADPQALANGLTIKFMNGDNAPHFIGTDFYTQGICYGLWKSNADTFFYSSAYYTKPAAFRVPLPANFTIPTTAPYQLYIPESQQPGFVTVDIDSPELNQFSINGVAIATLYTSGTTPPAINEIRLSANGLMQFNAANAGGVVTGYFAYVKD